MPSVVAGLSAPLPDPSRGAGVSFGDSVRVFCSFKCKLIGTHSLADDRYRCRSPPASEEHSTLVPCPAHLYEASCLHLDTVHLPGVFHTLARRRLPGIRFCHCSEQKKNRLEKTEACCRQVVLQDFKFWCLMDRDDGVSLSSVCVCVHNNANLLIGVQSLFCSKRDLP